MSRTGQGGDGRGGSEKAAPERPLDKGYDDPMGARFPERIGSYRLLSVLGAGGMGAVYRATHLTTGAVVALKTVERSNRASLHAIRQEVHGLSRLSHPGIAHILDSGTEQGVPWYAMELIDGRTLETVREDLWRSAPHSTAAAATWMGQAHETTHQAGVVQSTAKEPRSDRAGASGSKARARCMTCACQPHCGFVEFFSI